jgi:hypothetical protein
MNGNNRQIVLVALKEQKDDRYPGLSVDKKERLG